MTAERQVFPEQQPYGTIEIAGFNKTFDFICYHVVVAAVLGFARPPQLVTAIENFVAPKEIFAYSKVFCRLLAPGQDFFKGKSTSTTSQPNV